MTTYVTSAKLNILPLANYTNLKVFSNIQKTLPNKDIVLHGVT